MPFSLHFALLNHQKKFYFFPYITQYNKFKFLSYIGQLIVFAGFAHPPHLPLPRQKDFAFYAYRKLGEHLSLSGHSDEEENPYICRKLNSGLPVRIE
jgi:hypothetical protein